MKKVSIEINNRIYSFNADELIDISIPLRFNGAQPNAYGVEKAAAKACEAGDLVGDTRRGGSCNFEQITFIPHCNGTHTECVGHITNERISIHECLRDTFIPATLISITPENSAGTAETYSVNINSEDKLITRKALEIALGDFDENFLEALIVRTLPNDDNKLTATYLKEIQPFFSSEAMQFIVEKKIKHLLADLPSIDRIFDEGKLSNHRTFWCVKAGEFEVNQQSRIFSTITEMIYAPNFVVDGCYLLNLQSAAFMSDASPSRPFLFRIE